MKPIRGAGENKRTQGAGGSGAHWPRLLVAFERQFGVIKHVTRYKRDEKKAVPSSMSIFGLQGIDKASCCCAARTNLRRGSPPTAVRER